MKHKNFISHSYTGSILIPRTSYSMSNLLVSPPTVFPLPLSLRTSFVKNPGLLSLCFTSCMLLELFSSRYLLTGGSPHPP